MKKAFLLLLFSVFLFSCGTKYYVLNKHFNPRPTSQYKFKIDKNKSTTNINSVIDTNAIYLSSNFKRMTPGITGVYYRFMPNGVVYEVTLKGEPMKTVVKDTAMGDYGKYRVEKNRIKMEFMVVTVESGVPKDSLYKPSVVGKKFSKAIIKEGNLFMVPDKYYVEPKGFYKKAGEIGGNPFLFLFAVMVVTPVYLVDLVIPDEKVCFYRMNLVDAENCTKKNVLSE
ncbi:hypothetical protein FEDK69T_00480 [Flavobacterium enshiense DK69]|uniref:Lipoprotein n=1 Tax=Flavobacterium enshiense DK69 TaxID=1107311 RepID=V6SEF9_9FLAO|nr:hypothetical protein [Flavobacterium enshiense]ESU25083.1 hypothetical protein FEDK69T_00480 [Flavobacterium enshiense DK69]KGO97017.1 hypothetical protein Q767_04820 [Flavobacterium enshiense DK69]